MARSAALRFSVCTRPPDHVSTGNPEHRPRSPSDHQCPPGRESHGSAALMARRRAAMPAAQAPNVIEHVDELAIIFNNMASTGSKCRGGGNQVDSAVPA